jgi:cyclopropane fatty-acyl-phospholipid synthase-like methyltransferase
MGLLNRFRISPERAPAGVGARPHVHTTSVQPAPPSFAPREVRNSSSLRDFLWHIGGLGRGSLLDLGPAWQSTITFFIDRGFKVYTEDLLTGWKQYSQAETERQRTLPSEVEHPSPAEIANQFLESSLKFEPGSFDAVLAWDLLDYLDSDMMRRVAERMSKLLREGGVILAVFHSKRPDQFQRYRVLDEHSLELVPAPSVFPFSRSFQNREILELFSRFHTSKTYLGRDQLREALFVK